MSAIVTDVDVPGGRLVIDPPPGCSTPAKPTRHDLMRIDIVSIFPEYFGPLSVSLIGKAAARGDIEFYVHDLRQWAHDPHRTVDDTPFGGGPGMVMKPEVWGEALDEIAPPDRPPVPDQEPRLIVPTPSGVPFNQASAARYTKSQQLIFACGRYEGIDTRFIDEARSRMPVDEVSIGDYVLAGGEAAVLVMVEAISRLLPGVLGNERSASDDSFGGSFCRGRPAVGGVPPGGALVPDLGSFGGCPAGPATTRPAWPGCSRARSTPGPRVWRGREVPEVLLSGDHAAIARWRRDAALLRTAANRPDLIFRAAADPAALSRRDWQVLSAMGLSGVVRSSRIGPRRSRSLTSLVPRCGTLRFAVCFRRRRGPFPARAAVPAHALSRSA